MDCDPDSFYYIYFLWAHPFLEISLNLLLLFLLLAASALISAAEMAYFSLQPDDIFYLQKQNSKHSNLLLAMLEHSKHLLSTLLIANTFTNVAAVLVLGLLLNDCFASQNLVYFHFLIAWVLILCIGEISPKLYGSHKPLELALRLGYFVRFLNYCAAPANFFLVNFTNFIENKLKSKLNNTQHQEISSQDIEQVIDITTKQNKYAKRDAKMIKSLLHFANKNVRSAMRARMEIVAVEKNESFEQIVELFKESAFSRIPVYEDDADKIVGILHFKDVIYYLNKPEKWNVETVLREAYFVPENKKLDDLLADFQKEKQHLAVVIDEFGQTNGIITLEDVLENIVGEIEDEFDEPEIELFQIIDNQNFIFNALIPLDQMIEIANLEPQRFETLKQDSQTLAGLLMILHQQMPKTAEIIQYEELQFTILAANDRKIERVRLAILSDYLPLS